MFPRSLVHVGSSCCWLSVETSVLPQVERMLGDYSYNMEAGFPRASESKDNTMKATLIFLNPVSEVMHHHFCSIL